MARFIQLPSRKTINLDAVLWIDCPSQHRGLKIIFYGQSELTIRDEADKEMLLALFGLPADGFGEETPYANSRSGAMALSARPGTELGGV